MPVEVTNEACEEFARVLGSNCVTRESTQLSAAETATFATRQSIRAIIRPGTREEVQECVRIANRLRIPVIPISTGKNWGYGSRVPPADGCVLMDLGRMNRIVDYSESLAYVTLEPGVTQHQLIEFLRARKSRLWLDATGSTPASSIIGNTMERGFGHTPYGDHFANSCALEVVLPNGDCIDTGFARYNGAVAAPVYRWGTGPVLDGLFSQSGMGIVTRMTVWLMPAPEYFQAFFFKCDRDEDLAPLIDALRPLRINNTIRSSVHVGNGYKVISGMMQYPWDRMGGRTPMAPPDLDAFGRELNFGKWNGSGGLYGSRGQVREARRLIQEALRGKVSALRFLDDRKLALAERFAGPAQWFTKWDLSRAIELVRPIYELLKGVPTDHPLRSAYWRKRGPVPSQMDPDRDRCGLIWCAPIAPLTGEDASRVAGLASNVLLKWGFEPMLSLTLVTERALACVVSITYDRDLPDEDRKALACYHELVNVLVLAGYRFYRLGIQSMEQMGSSESYDSLLNLLKRTLDPAGILAPGRYQSTNTSSCTEGTVQ